MWSYMDINKQCCQGVYSLQQWLITLWRWNIIIRHGKLTQTTSLNIFDNNSSANDCDRFWITFQNQILNRFPREVTPSYSNTQITKAPSTADCVSVDKAVISPGSRLSLWLQILWNTFSIQCFLSCCLVLEMWCNGSTRWSQLLNSFTVRIPLKAPVKVKLREHLVFSK